MTTFCVKPGAKTYFYTPKILSTILIDSISKQINLFFQFLQPILKLLLLSPQVTSGSYHLQQQQNISDHELTIIDISWKGYTQYPVWSDKISITGGAEPHISTTTLQSLQSIPLLIIYYRPWAFHLLLTKADHTKVATCMVGLSLKTVLVLYLVNE